MSDFVDVEIIQAHDPETGETVEAVVVPKGYYLCLLTPATAAKYKDWTEVKAIRIATEDDQIAALEVSDDEDWLTDPEAQK